MSELSGIITAVIGALLGVHALQFAVVVVRLLRFPLHPLHFAPLETAPGLRAHEAVTIAELEGLGFRQTGWATVARGERRTPVFYLRHETTPALAEVTLMDGGFGGHVVAFHTFGVDGAHLITTNRLGWVVSSPTPGTLSEDAYADSLADHWQAHCARIRPLELARVEEGEAQRRLMAWSEDYLDRLLAAGAIQRVGDGWHFTLRTALAMAWAWRRVRGKLMRPYRSAAGDAHPNVMSAEYYLQLEADERARPSRRDVKLWVLALSTVVSLALWGLIFSWTTAVALVAIILFHETGHALAMRAFGYRDMHMFMVPLLGAMVTGSPRETAAWKQAVMLLAGPVPGLLLGIGGLIYLDAHPLAGAGYEWQQIVAMAIGVNLFNLLPITPLDGGQLMEVALFSRWPRARFAFVVLSVIGFLGLASWIGGTTVWVIAVVLVWSMAGQWRVARLQGAWTEQTAKQRQLEQLFDYARNKLRVQGFARQYALVKAVFTSRSIGRPRAWESAVVLCLMGGLWGGIAWVAFPGQAHEYEMPADTTRSAAQVAFDDAFERFEESEGEARSMGELEARAEVLDPLDPRQVDLAAMRALSAGPRAQRAQLDALLAAGREGLNYPLAAIGSNLLWLAETESLALAPGQRADLLQAEIDHVMKRAPGAFEGTVHARLRVAEALDRAGKPELARARLRELKESNPETNQVTRAEAWFHLSNGRPEEAVSLLEVWQAQERPGYPGYGLAVDHAWALIAAGRTAEGLARMETAVYVPSPRQTFLERIRLQNPRPVLLYPLDLAYALIRAGRPGDARALIEQNGWNCWLAGEKFETRGWVEPWQEGRERTRWETANTLCPAPGQRGGCKDG